MRKNRGSEKTGYRDHTNEAPGLDGFLPIDHTLKMMRDSGVKVCRGVVLTSPGGVIVGIWRVLATDIPVLFYTTRILAWTIFGQSS